MHIEELKEGEEDQERVSSRADLDVSNSCRSVSDAKRVLVGAGARALFYPTLLYNVLRNKIQSEFRWWDRVDEFILLGAVPFPTDVLRLKELGVSGVVTLNEQYETLVPTSLYHAYNIEHLVIPTRDYLFAPSFVDICQAVEFIQRNASLGKTTYVHCKAGRGRSTTIVLCYLVEHKDMTPHAAYKYVRSIRPRVLLASSQWQAVEAYYLYKVQTGKPGSLIVRQGLDLLSKEDAKEDSATFDDGSVVVITESDLDGYEAWESGVVNNTTAELRVACRFASQTAISRLSRFWLGCHVEQKCSRKKLEGSNGTDQLSSLSIDIQVY